MKEKGSQRVGYTATFPKDEHKMKNEIDKSGSLEIPPWESIFGSALVLLSTGVTAYGFVIPNVLHKKDKEKSNRSWIAPLVRSRNKLKIDLKPYALNHL